MLSLCLLIYYMFFGLCSMPQGICLQFQHEARWVCLLQGYHQDLIMPHRHFNQGDGGGV